MNRSRLMTIAAMPGFVLAAVAATTTSCFTPAQSRSMQTQIDEIRRQVDALHDQQNRNGSAIREVTTRADLPRVSSEEERARPKRDADGARSATGPGMRERSLVEAALAPGPARQGERGVTVPPVASGAAATGEAAGRGTPPQPGPLYRRGYVLYHQGGFARAEEALGSFLLAEPYSPYAENARYWIGECRYARGLYREAIEAFREVIDRHPGGGKASHALYKIALSFERLGEAGGMQQALHDLLERFPESDVAPLARSRLGGA